MLKYEMPLYRPPSEGNNLIIQATIGCSFNRCTFCSMYREKSYRARELDSVLSDIDKGAAWWPEASRVFLADGDALALPTEHLIQILTHLARRFPRLTRVSCYALPANLLNKSVAELALLRANRLSLIYYGIESGYAPLLKRIRKGASPAAMVEGLLKAHEAQIKVSATVVLGLGGKELWQEHIEGTVALLHQVPLHYLSTLQLHLEESVQADFLARFDPPFEFQDDEAVLAEQYRLIDTLTTPPKRLIFRSNHASNALALAGNLPKDRLRLLAEIDAARQQESGLRPEWLRSL
ncbi:MAG: radical SAM protein [Magnetococcales bacterium]|nr:radical SAM protein [Magnetococcales bacterium]